jgi:hypothetical protein
VPERYPGRTTGVAQTAATVEANQTTGSDLMNPELNYLIAKQRTADLIRSAEQGRLARHARTLKPSDAQLGLRARLLVRSLLGRHAPLLGRRRGQLHDGGGQKYVPATYRGNYDRLARVKGQYDPDNVFCVNQSIQP